MSKLYLEIITPGGIFFSGLVETVVVEEESNTPGQRFRRLKKGEIKFCIAGSKEKKTVLIPNGHIYVGKGLFVYTKYANWKREKI